MRVSVTISIDINAAAWAEEYGLERGEVRDDVKHYVANAIHEHLGSLGLLAERGVGANSGANTPDCK